MPLRLVVVDDDPSAGATLRDNLEIDGDSGGGHPIEAEMLIPKYTVEDLKNLPLRAIATFAVRCARRVAHLAILPDDDPGSERLRSAVKDAIDMAEDFVRGLPCRTCATVVRQIEVSRDAARGEFVREQAMGAVIQAAHTAATALHALDLKEESGETPLLAPAANPRPLAQLADVTASLAALAALTAAEDAAGAVGYGGRFIRGATADYEGLLRLDLGTYPQAGGPIDPSPKGPLGPLWPKAHAG